MFVKSNNCLKGIQAFFANVFLGLPQGGPSKSFCALMGPIIQDGYPHQANNRSFRNGRGLTLFYKCIRSHRTLHCGAILAKAIYLPAHPAFPFLVFPSCRPPGVSPSPVSSGRLDGAPSGSRHASALGDEPQGAPRYLSEGTVQGCFP